MTTPGWYADPLGRAELRWYRGAAWGDQVRTGAREGQDPIDLAGEPLWPEPRWSDVPGAGVPAGQAPVALAAGVQVAAPPAAPGGRGIGRGTRVAIIAVVLLTVGLLVAGAAAVLVLIRNVPTLTGSQIEAQVAAELSARLGRQVRVECPSVAYAGTADGTIECLATPVSGPSAEAVRVEVVVRDAAVRRWEVLPHFVPGDPA